MCVCQRQCPPVNRKKLVCGSDGHIYPSHCEMHRAACISETAITVQRGVHCIKQGKGWAPGFVPENTESSFEASQKKLLENITNYVYTPQTTTELVSGYLKC